MTFIYHNCRKRTRKIRPDPIQIKILIRRNQKLNSNLNRNKLFFSKLYQPFFQPVRKWKIRGHKIFKAKSKHIDTYLGDLGTTQNANMYICPYAKLIMFFSFSKLCHTNLGHLISIYLVILLILVYSTTYIFDRNPVIQLFSRSNWEYVITVFWFRFFTFHLYCITI